jgi:hypothetical protein
MQFSPLSCHFIPLRTKYSPQHPVLKHPFAHLMLLWVPVTLNTKLRKFLNGSSLILILSHVYVCDYRQVLDRWLDLLTTYTLTTRDYTTLHYTICFLETDFNGGDFSAFVLMPFLAGHCLTTELSSKLCLAYNPSAQTNRKHRSSIVPLVYIGGLT